MGTSVSRSSARPEATPSESALREHGRAIDGAPTLRHQHVSGGAAVFVLAAVAGLAGLAASALGDAGAGLVWAVMA